MRVVSPKIFYLETDKEEVENLQTAQCLIGQILEEMTSTRTNTLRDRKDESCFIYSTKLRETYAILDNLCAILNNKSGRLER